MKVSFPLTSYEIKTPGPSRSAGGGLGLLPHDEPGVTEFIILDTKIPPADTTILHYQ